MKLLVRGQSKIFTVNYAEYHLKGTDHPWLLIYASMKNCYHSLGAKIF